jgi:carbon starvation protein
MSLLTIVLISTAVLSIAYVTYGRLLARLLGLDPNRPTPAVELKDGIDYEPIAPKFLLSQHFSAIAAAGPIVGPILAGVFFGWLPALLWILIGSVFIGGVHDMTSLTASIRHKARSIAEVVREHMTRRSYLLFLSFVWIALVYIIVAFTDLTANAFIGAVALPNGETVRGGGIATSSIVYLVLPIIMGLLLRHTKLSLNLATIIFLPLAGLAIWLGQQFPLALQEIVPGLGDGVTGADNTRRVWDVLLLVYCLIAGVVPVWLLLQPRGHLGGYFLYIARGGAALGLIFGGGKVNYPAYTVQEGLGLNGAALIPMLFITIACGACSGFHSLICSGTTSKQLAKETDARKIGYGAMLLEGMVAVVSLCCVMMLVKGDSALMVDGKLSPRPDMVYALGIGSFLQKIGISPQFAVAFAFMAFTTFIYDTLDVCTRLGRFIIQELTGLRNAAGRWIGTSLTAGVPLFFLLQPGVAPDGTKLPPVWMAFWSLFGASNQLLAALTLLGVTVWIWQTRKAMWVWLVTGIPTVLMYVMSTWALLLMTLPKFHTAGGWVAPKEVVPWVGVVLLVLAALMLIEAILVITRGRSGPPVQKQPQLATA